MRKNYIRIKIIDNASYLVYQRGLIYEIAGIVLPYSRLCSALIRAKEVLRENIQEMRKINKNVENKILTKPSQSILKLLKQKREMVWRQAFESKKPVNDVKHVGVEIEFCSKDDREDIAKSLASAGIASYCELKHDGSVKGNRDGNYDCDGSCREDCNCADCGETHFCDDESDCTRRTRNERGASHSHECWEYREDCNECTDTETLDDCDCGGQNEEGENLCNGEHVICTGHCEGHSCNGYDDHPDYDCNCDCTCGNDEEGHELAIVAQSTEISGIIKKACQVLESHSAYVNYSCGLHVHIDARNRNEKRIFANLVNSQKLLYSMVPRSRYENDYCKPCRGGLEMSDYSERYLGVNPQSYEEHKTIEVRLHSGTINAVKINNWIKLLQKIAYTKNIKCVMTRLSELTNAVNISENLLNYIVERIEKFKPEHKLYSIKNDLKVKNVSQDQQYEESEAA